MKNGSRSYIQVGHDMLTFIVRGGGVTHFPIGASIDVNKHDYLICLFFLILFPAESALFDNSLFSEVCILRMLCILKIGARVSLSLRFLRRKKGGG